MWVPGRGLIKKIIGKKIAKELEKEVGKMPKSWRTTGYGLSMILAALANVARILLDDDPSTVVDWGLSIAAFQAGLGFISSRDQKAHDEGTAGQAEKSSANKV